VPTVVRGEGRGRWLGIPTANVRSLRTSWCRLAASTVYATRGDDSSGGRQYRVRPTFGGVTQAVEAHLLDTSLDLHGKVLELAFAERLRDEISFDGPDALLRQIRTDIESARRVLGTTPKPSII
jgi:riboflavin kinase/FMN adenylyltransferase